METVQNRLGIVSNQTNTQNTTGQTTSVNELDSMLINNTTEIADPQLLFWDPMSIIEGVVENAKKGKFDRQSSHLLMTALQAQTGIEPNQKNQHAVYEFLNAILEKQSADVNGDFEVNGKDMLQVFETGEFNPVTIGNDPPPRDNPVDIIQEFIDQAKEEARGNTPIHPMPNEILFKALEEVTGQELNDKRKEAVLQFLDAVKQNKPADVNGTGPTDIKDILQVYEKGKFVPVGHDPVEPHPSPEPEPKPIPYPEYIGPPVESTQERERQKIAA